ncbi:MAG: glycosyltransferase family 25 protein [Chthoniobacterales bacterium]
MDAYIINLDRAPERWIHIQETFASSTITPRRITAVDGNAIALPHPDFDEKSFRLFHGRAINIYEVACYFSHIKALRAFLETEEKYALICEDDICLAPGFDELITSLMNYSSTWNIVRLTGLSQGKAFQIKKLISNYSVMVHLGRLKGAGAYLIDRKAAEIFVKRLLPMWLPWDHAIDREWFFGLKAFAVAPFPISQTNKKFRSAIQENSQQKLSTLERWLTTYPYQMGNELCRWFFRLESLLFSYRKSS